MARLRFVHGDCPERDTTTSSSTSTSSTTSTSTSSASAPCCCTLNQRLPHLYFMVHKPSGLTAKTSVVISKFYFRKHFYILESGCVLRQYHRLTLSANQHEHEYHDLHVIHHHVVHHHQHHQRAVWAWREGEHGQDRRDPQPHVHPVPTAPVRACLACPSPSSLPRVSLAPYSLTVD